MNSVVAFPAACDSTDRTPKLRALPSFCDEGLLSYLSASRLKTWQTCRRQFYFRYVERIEVPTASALFIGRQVHELLSIWNWARWKEEPADREHLRARFCQTWDEDQVDDEIRWASDEDERKAKAQAWQMLETYLDQAIIPADEKPEGVEVELECNLDDLDSGNNGGIPPLVGIIDLIREGGRIVDYKTASRTPNHRLASLQHETQLVCYALLYRAATGHTESGFELQHLIKTKEPKIVVTPLEPINRAQEEHFFRLIDDYLVGIADEAWIPSPGQHCAWCDYAAQCRAMSTSGG